MKLASALPSFLARVMDLIDRDVTSDIEVFQQTPFPLLQLPSAIRSSAPLGTTVLNDSMIFLVEANVPASSAQVAQDICRLGRGVWDIYFNAQYSASFRSFAVVGYVFKYTDPVSGTQVPLLTIQPASQNEHVFQRWRLTVDRQDLQFNVLLGATGVAQDHFTETNLYFCKLA